MVRWKPLLGKGKKEIACERVRERGGPEEGEAESPPLLIRQFMALLFNKAIQGGEAQWTGCSLGSIAMNPRLVCIGTTYLLGGPVELSVGLCVSSIDLHCVSSGPSPSFPQKTCEWREQRVTGSCFHPFNFIRLLNPAALTETNIHRKMTACINF